MLFEHAWSACKTNWSPNVPVLGICGTLTLLSKPVPAVAKTFATAAADVPVKLGLGRESIMPPTPAGQGPMLGIGAGYVDALEVG